MAGNSNLASAMEAKQDEFYTQLRTIEDELRHYRKHFKGKTVLCNCDDPFESNFFKYFALNFNKLGLKKLIATCYAGSSIAGTQLSLFGDDTDEERRTPYKAIVTTVHDATGNGGVDMLDVAELFRNGENRLEKLEGDGDFRSRECLELLDIGITKTWFGLANKVYPKQIQVNRQGKRSQVTKLNDGAVIKVAVPPEGKTYYIVEDDFYIQTYPRLLIKNKNPEVAEK